MGLGCADGLTRFFDPQELYGSQTFALGATTALMCFYHSYPLIVHIHLLLISFYH
jgi:hypothetical protein